MNIFEFKDYRYLVNYLLLNKVGKGSKTKLAQELNCHPAYISQVLNKGKIHFSLENIIKISSFLDLSSEEEEYLIMLLEYERATLKKLKFFWEKKIVKLQSENSKIYKQLSQNSSELSNEDKAIYYSHWAYASIHMIVSIKRYKKISIIAKELGLNDNFVKDIIEFLLQKKLINEDESGYFIGDTRIHLKAQSHLIKMHHQNYRQFAIQSLDQQNDFNLHYSSVLTLSNSDCLKVRDLVLKLIKDKEKILLPSENEEMLVFNLDLFKPRREH